MSCLEVKVNVKNNWILTTEMHYPQNKNLKEKDIVVDLPIEVLSPPISESARAIKT